MTENPRPERRVALLSVSDKTGLEPFAAALVELGFELLSTGGTAARLREAGLPVTGVSELTGFPEIMDGRVKTLHPMIHGGLLGRPGIDAQTMADHGMPSIDLLVLNLYPFEATVADADCTLDDAIENIDIGGPAMLRAGAKNFERVAVVTDPSQYPSVQAELRDGQGTLDRETRYELAVAAFNHVARYDAAIGNYLSSTSADGERRRFPTQGIGCVVRLGTLRYGENPHQEAAWYREMDPPTSGLVNARQHQGKPLSFNNIADADAAWSAVTAFDAPACVIVKHANPCGVAVDSDPLAAYRAAFATDPTSSFGGIIAFNRPIDDRTAQTILDNQFVEVLVAPGFDDDALNVLNGKPNVRALELALPDRDSATGTLDLKRIAGGVLVQTADVAVVTRDDCRVVSRRQPDDDAWDELMFAWKVVKAVKSNAIVYSAGQRTLGIGAGQMSRVDSARIARWKAADAGLDLAGATMASDAFFPFRDGIDTAAEAGISAVIQPGGSMRDEEVIAAADEHDMVMVMTGIRHFRH